VTPGSPAVDDAWTGGWWQEAHIVPSPNFGPRPAGAQGRVTLVVIHSISLPPGEYGGPAVQELFTNRLDFDSHPAFESLRGLEVSAHFFIRRDGQVLQFVSCDDRAWHAGVSQWRGRTRCNDHSIGIELEGLEGLEFEEAQYARLEVLLRALAARHDLHDVVGHEHIAPGRKSDPGSGFHWGRLIKVLSELSLSGPPTLTAAKG